MERPRLCYEGSPLKKVNIHTPKTLWENEIRKDSKKRGKHMAVADICEQIPISPWLHNFIQISRYFVNIILLHKRVIMIQILNYRGSKINTFYTDRMLSLIHI